MQKREDCKTSRNEKRKRPYHRKYDHTNLGTKYVFGWFYEYMAHSGIRSNLVACCGEDFSRYIDYASMIATGKAKAFLVEKDAERFERIRKGVKGYKNVVAIKHNVFNYIDNPKYGMVKHARVVDIGLGIGVKELLLSAAPLLQKQSSLNHKLWKAQILDGAIRQKNSGYVLDCYITYLKTIGLKIKSINGIDIETDTKGTCLSHKNALVVKRYPDKLSGTSGIVYQHNVVLEVNNRQAILFIFECKNGSWMMQSLLMFK